MISLRTAFLLTILSLERGCSPSMSDPNAPETQTAPESAEPTESFNEIFSQYEREHKRKKNEDGGKQLDGTVIASYCRLGIAGHRL